MSIVTVNGSDYVKASSLARKYRYTNDYIGQLCRAGKVSAELIGRTWYVSEESLISHKKGRYTKNLPAEKIIILEPETRLSRVEVAPVLTKRTIKLGSQNSKSKNYSSRIDWKPVEYEFDRAALIPEIGSDNTKNIDISLVDSTKVKIKKLSDTTFLSSDKLPEVSLVGRVLVTASEENEEEEATFEGDFEYSEPEPAPRNSFTPKSMMKRREVVAVESERITGRYSLVAVLTLVSVLLLTIFSESEVVADVWSYEAKMNFSSEYFLANLSKIP